MYGSIAVIILNESVFLFIFHYFFEIKVAIIIPFVCLVSILIFWILHHKRSMIALIMNRTDMVLIIQMEKPVEIQFFFFLLFNPFV
jgi:hypothetical protein